jgi:hypothetical protein
MFTWLSRRSLSRRSFLLYIFLKMRSECLFLPYFLLTLDCMVAVARTDLCKTKLDRPVFDRRCTHACLTAFRLVHWGTMILSLLEKIESVYRPREGCKLEFNDTFILDVFYKINMTESFAPIKMIKLNLFFHMYCLTALYVSNAGLHCTYLLLDRLVSDYCLTALYIQTYRLTALYRQT